MRRSAAAVAAVVMLAGCGAGASPVEPGDGWVGPGSERASEDVISVRRGPEHCDWGSALLLHVGWPLDDPNQPEDFRMYVRDPRGVFEGFDERQADFDADADLPEGAEPTGWRTEGAELWLAAASADEAVYVLGDDGGVEQWPRIDPPLGCA